MLLAILHLDQATNSYHLRMYCLDLLARLVRTSVQQFQALAFLLMQELTILTQAFLFLDLMYLALQQEALNALALTAPAGC
jgi:hypothetical protein